MYKSLPNNVLQLKQVSAVHQEYFRHADSVENKMVSILEDIIDVELAAWEARPPIPSTPISNVSKNIVKFREAIGTVLSEKQVRVLNIFSILKRMFCKMFISFRFQRYL